MTIGQRIKNRRKELGLSVDDVAERLGKNRATVYRYESGSIEDMPSAVLESLAKVLNTTPADLMGWREQNEMAHEQSAPHKGTCIPVFGKVAAGIPIEMITDIIDQEEITEEMARRGEYFGLRIKGDSMEPRIWDGDVVIVRSQDDAESGELVIATVNGSDATCKRLKKYDGGIWLMSMNTKYEPMNYTDEEILNKPVKILGKVVEVRGKLE